MHKMWHYQVCHTLFISHFLVKWTVWHYQGYGVRHAKSQCWLDEGQLVTEVNGASNLVKKWGSTLLLNLNVLDMDVGNQSNTSCWLPTIFWSSMKVNCPMAVIIALWILIKYSWVTTNNHNQKLFRSQDVNCSTQLHAWLHKNVALTYSSTINSWFFELNATHNSIVYCQLLINNWFNIVNFLNYSYQDLIFSKTIFFHKTSNMSIYL